MIRVKLQGDTMVFTHQMEERKALTAPSLAKLTGTPALSCCWCPWVYLPWRAACHYPSKLQTYLSFHPAIHF